MAGSEFDPLIADYKKQYGMWHQGETDRLASLMKLYGRDPKGNKLPVPVPATVAATSWPSPVGMGWLGSPN
jgi:hypothetical protein